VRSELQRRHQNAPRLLLPHRQQTALGVAGGVLMANALSNAFASGEQAVTGLAEEASATAEEAVSPFQDAAAEPPPEEQDMGGFDDFGEKI
jgi:hypothetical protein